jgi:hypothetical protein
MDLELAVEAYRQGAEGGPESICLNMYPEQIPSEDGRSYELKQIGGLSLFVDLGAAVRGWLALTDLFNGDIFAVAGTNVFRINSAGVATNIGTVPATGNVTIDATRIELGICVAPNLYTTDGATVTQVTDIDLPTNLTSVTAINQRFLVSTSADQYHWSELLAGGTWAALDFATAEAMPDNLIRVYSDGDRVHAFGGQSTEVIGAVTNPTSSSNAFSRLGGAVIRLGLAGIHAVATDIESKAVAFVANTRVIYATNGYQAQPISTPYIDGLMRDATATQMAGIRLYAYSEGGHSFLIVNIPDVGTFGFEKKLGKYHQRQTFGFTNWRGNMYVRAFGKHYVADEGDTKIWLLSDANLNDAGLKISREFTANAPVRSIVSLSELVLDCYTDRDAVVSMRYSDDGRNYTSFVDRNITSPDSIASTSWRRMRGTKPPRRVFHFRATDDCPLVVRGARINDGDVR